MLEPEAVVAQVPLLALAQAQVLLPRRSQLRRKRSQRRTSTWAISSVAATTTIEENAAITAWGVELRPKRPDGLTDKPVAAPIQPPCCAADEKVFK